MKILKVESFVSTLAIVFIFNISFADCGNFKDRVKWDEIETKTWHEYKEKFKKDGYENGREESRRRIVFFKNLQRIVKHNLDFKDGEETYEMRIYEVADRRFKEIESKKDNDYDPEDDDFDDWDEKFGIKDRTENESFKAKDGWLYIPKIKEDKTPISFDLRKYGVITDVKDQGSCGSCYAVASVDALESRLLREHNKHFHLSIQEVVDCSRNYDNFGCDGGFPHHVFQYIKDKGGIADDEEYSYNAKNGTCKSNNKTRIPIDLAGYKYIKASDYQNQETLLKQALVEYGPIVVEVHVSVQFMYYSNGIFNHKDCHLKDENSNSMHVLLLVGYDSEDGVDYWIAKNSWGFEWGERGYIRIKRLSDEDCGFLSYDAHVPILQTDIEKKNTVIDKKADSEPDKSLRLWLQQNYFDKFNEKLELLQTLSFVSIIIICAIVFMMIYLIVMMSLNRIKPHSFESLQLG